MYFSAKPRVKLGFLVTRLSPPHIHSLLLDLQVLESPTSDHSKSRPLLDRHCLQTRFTLFLCVSVASLVSVWVRLLYHPRDRSPIGFSSRLPPSRQSVFSCGVSSRFISCCSLCSDIVAVVDDTVVARVKFCIPLLGIDFAPSSLVL